jgi:hypothetical protein
MKKTFSFNTLDVFTAAFLAQQKNQAYIKYNFGDKKSNRQLVFDVLENVSSFTPEDHENGQKILSYYKGLVFKILKGIPLNAFEKQVVSIVEKEQITTVYDVAIIASLPSSYEKSLKRDIIKERLNFAKGGFISTVGSKATLDDVEIIKNVYSTKFETFFVTGITPLEQPLYFSSKKELQVGSKVSVTGTVKAHKEKITQLNRVKVINGN